MTSNNEQGQGSKGKAGDTPRRPTGDFLSPVGDLKNRETEVVFCPQCKKPDLVPQGSESYKCSHCGKIVTPQREEPTQFLKVAKCANCNEDFPYDGADSDQPRFCPACQKGETVSGCTDAGEPAAKGDSDEVAQLKKRIEELEGHLAGCHASSKKASEDLQEQVQDLQEKWQLAKDQLEAQKDYHQIKSALEEKTSDLGQACKSLDEIDFLKKRADQADSLASQVADLRDKLGIYSQAQQELEDLQQALLDQDDDVATAAIWKGNFELACMANVTLKDRVERVLRQQEAHKDQLTACKQRAADADKLLREKQSQLLSQQEKYQEQLTACRQEQINLQAAKEAALKQASADQEKQQALHKQLQDQQQKNDKLEADLASANQAVQQEQANTAKVAVELEKLAADKKDLKDQIKSLDKQLDRLEKDLQQKDQQLAVLAKKLEAEQAARQADVARLQVEVEGQKYLLELARQSNQLIFKENQDMLTAKQQVQQRADSLADEVGRLSQDLNQANGDLITCQAKLDALQNNLHDLKEQNSKLCSKFDEKEQAFYDQEMAARDLKEQLAESHLQLADHKIRLAMREAKISSLEESKQSLVDELTNVREGLELFTKELYDLRLKAAQVEALAETLADKESKLKELEEKLSQERDDIEAEVVSRVAILRRQIDEWKDAYQISCDRQRDLYVKAAIAYKEGELAEKERRLTEALK